ncbi:hypothetical protein [Epibacterium sp. Ofav1-8]|uniref:hypothetical protein n=1 Tax=Epibacterium sp. Ofav1-8 TaxID=2917735 RepID=UPI001EF45DA2|nr:hypothetical protein [Epibacterium sp. Ofav1-8]MCG7622248.1 hypothetical protein [Epibacterium sp. Ofav1-8]
MQPATPTADALLDAARPTVWQTLSRILLLAIPFAVGAAATSTLNLGKVALLARVPDTGALNTLSLLQPSFILALAIMEGLAITAQVFSARSRHNWPRRGTQRAVLRLCRNGVILFVIVAAVGYAAAETLPVQDPEIRLILAHFPLFMLSLVPFVVFDIFYGAMRGQGKVLLGLVPFVGLVAIDLTTTYVLVSQYGWGFEAVLIGNLVGPILMLPVIALLLRRELRDGEDSPEEPFRIRIRQLQIGVGIPVFSSIVVGFVSASVVFPILSKIGEDSASAFFVVLRYRIAFMIPAIAIGSAIAILVNQLAEQGQTAQRLRYLIIGVPFMLCLYAIVTALLPQWTGALDLLVPEQAEALRAATNQMFTELLITFFLISGSAMLQVILEQLGRGVQVLVITFLIEAGTCAAVLWAMMQGAGMGLILDVLIAAAAGSFGLFAVQFLLLLRSLGRAHAV